MSPFTYPLPNYRVGLSPRSEELRAYLRTVRYSSCLFALPKQCLVCLRLPCVSVVREGFEPSISFRTAALLPFLFTVWFDLPHSSFLRLLFRHLTISLDSEYSKLILLDLGTLTCTTLLCPMLRMGNPLCWCNPSHFVIHFLHYTFLSQGNNTLISISFYDFRL